MGNYIFIDVREPEEYQSGHVEGALNIPASDFLNKTDKLDGVEKDTPIIVYCRSGARSNVAMQFLKQMGFSDVTNGINKDQVEARYL